MSELLVRTALPHHLEAKLPEQRHGLARLQDWRLAHGLCHVDSLGPDEHAAELRVTVLQEHLNNLL